MPTTTKVLKTVKFRRLTEVLYLSKRRRATGYEVEQTTVTEEGQPDKVTVRNLAVCEHFNPTSGWVKTTLKDDREGVYNKIAKTLNLKFLIQR